MSRYLRQPRVVIRLGGVSITNGASSSNEQADDSASATEWQVGGSYTKSEIIEHNGSTYIVMQDITDALEHQSPSAEGVLALYMLWRGDSLLEWVSGEYIEQGWQRSYNDSIYQCITATAGANIYTPEDASSVWEVIQNAEA